MASLPSPSAELRLDRRIALGLALAALCLYARSLAFPFLELDAVFRENPFWGRPGPLLGWGVAWRAGGAGGLALLLESALGGGSPVLSRAIGILLLATCSGLLFSALRRLGIPRGPSALCGALLAFHPLRIESVTALAQRSALIAALACALALWIFAGAARPGSGDTGRGARLALGVLLSLALVLFPLRALPDDLGFSTRLLHAPLVLATLAWRTLWPAGLAWFPPHPAVLGAGPPAPVLAAGWLAAAGVVVLLWRSRRSRIAQGGGWFLALASPQVLFPGDEAGLAANWSTLASPGLELALVLGAGAGLARLGVAPRARLALGTTSVLALGALSWMHLPDWSSGRALAERALEASRDNYRAHDLLGQVWLAQGRLSEAAREHERALDLRPVDAPALLHLGEIELRRALIPGQEAHFALARGYFERSLQARPGSARAWERTGEVSQRAEELERARSELARALELEPARGEAAARLGMVLLALGDADGALAAFEHASRMRPGLPEGWCGQGLARFQRDELELALALFEEALAREPDHVESRTTRGRIRETRGDLPGAESDYRRAVGVNPDNADALYALAALCERTERGAEALHLVERLLASRPAHVRANMCLARITLGRGEPARAQAALERVLRLNPEQAEARLLLERARGMSGNGAGDAGAERDRR